MRSGAIFVYVLAALVVWIVVGCVALESVR